MDLKIPLIELRENNPYSIGSIFVFDDGDFALDPGTMNYQKSELDKYFTVVQGDSLNSIAHEAYQDSKEWWRMAMVNDIEDIFNLKPGITLIIPDLDTLKVTSL